MQRIQEGFLPVQQGRIERVRVVPETMRGLRQVYFHAVVQLGMRHAVEIGIPQERNFPPVCRNLDEVAFYVADDLPRGENDNAEQRRQQRFLRKVEVEILWQFLP